MISCENVSFSYDAKPFIRGVSFEVSGGEIFGFLGPSGAGKSTLQKILTGTLGGWHGTAIVAGTDVRRRTNAFYERVGVDFEFPALYEKLTARENLDFFGSLYRQKPVPAGELLEMIGLALDADKKVAEFSKGMKSRLNFVKAIAHRPDVLFLDEPTSGLDPVNSRAMKEIIRSERDRGAAIILTTHNMHDAAELCDRVAFFVDGAVRALDTPDNLIHSRGGTRIRYSWLESNASTVSSAAGNQARELSAEIERDKMSEDPRLAELIRSNAVRSIHSLEPTLEDIFVEVTGRGLE
jgi:fluoroquinolone transport system ATP-binding protein